MNFFDLKIEKKRKIIDDSQIRKIKIMLYVQLPQKIHISILSTFPAKTKDLHSRSFNPRLPLLFSFTSVCTHQALRDISSCFHLPRVFNFHSDKATHITYTSNKPRKKETASDCNTHIYLLSAFNFHFE